MAQFTVGVAAGILVCIVVLLVRCCVWFEKQHPEDDYWHRLDDERRIKTK